MLTAATCYAKLPRIENSYGISKAKGDRRQAIVLSKTRLSSFASRLSEGNLESLINKLTPLNSDKIQKNLSISAAYSILRICI